MGEERVIKGGGGALLHWCCCFAVFMVFCDVEDHEDDTVKNQQLMALQRLVLLERVVGQVRACRSSFASCCASAQNLAAAGIVVSSHGLYW